jgi:NitT/TauT family transport system permease protein
VVGFSPTFFFVLAATVAGIRSVNNDHLVLSKSLGATPRQVFSKMMLLSAVPRIFAGFRLGLIFSLLGVVGAELLAAEHELGQTIAQIHSTFDMTGVMGLLTLLGLGVTMLMNCLERRDPKRGATRAV